MRNLRLQFEDECCPVWIGVRCLDEIISSLRELNASSYHLIADRTVGKLHASILYEQLSAHVLLAFGSLIMANHPNPWKLSSILPTKW